MELNNYYKEIRLNQSLVQQSEDLGFIVHPHPILSEILMEVSDAGLNKAIFQFNKRVK